MTADVGFVKLYPGRFVHKMSTTRRNDVCNATAGQPCCDDVAW